MDVGIEVLFTVVVDQHDQASVWRKANVRRATSKSPMACG